MSRKCALAGGVLCALVLVALPAYANGSPETLASPMFYFLLLLWFVLGVYIWAATRQLKGLLPAVIVLFGGSYAAPDFHYPDLAIYVWAVYVGLLTMYYLFPRPGVSPSQRRVNLAFHGITLAALIVSGLVANLIHWGEYGRVPWWRAWGWWRFQVHCDWPAAQEFLQRFLCSVAVLVVLFYAVIGTRTYFVAGRLRVATEEEREVEKP